MARLSLMPAGRIRARARFTSGYGGGCSGLQETTCSYPSERTPQQRWREDFFNTFENSGDAADMADPDADGQPNFMEFAFGTNPLASVQTGIPQWQRSELFSSFSLDFTAKAGTENFRFSGEWLGDAQISGGWNISQNLGRQPDWTFREVIANRPNQFGRLRIVLPSSKP